MLPRRAERWLLGGAVNDVGRVVSWGTQTLRLPGNLGPLLAAEPGAGTPLVLPYLTGERAPGWAARARAHLAGVTAATTAEDLFRGALEGVALTYERIAALLPEPTAIRVSGRVAADLPEWLQVLADTLGRPVTHVTQKRATLRGTALLALAALGSPVPWSKPVTGATYEPAADRAGYYRGRRRAYAELYEAVVRG